MQSSNVNQAAAPHFPALGKPDGPASRLPELDGLRGVAILLVLHVHLIVFHTRLSPVWSLVLGQWMPQTGAGVDLFFVLSGFLIGGILLDHRNSSHYFSTFYARRFWRIVPLYGVVCGAFWFAGVLLDHWHIARQYWLFHDPLPWYSYATFTQNIWMALRGAWFGAEWLEPTWSLACEEQFYLLAPLVIWLIPPERLPRFLGVAVVLGWIAREFSRGIFLYVFPHGGLTAFVMMPCHLDGLAAGVLAAWAVRTPWALAWLAGKRSLLRWVMAAGLTGIFVFVFEGWHMLTHEFALVGFPVVAVFFGAVLIYVVIFPGGALGRILRARVLRVFGTISYGLYLLHQPVWGLCSWVLNDKWPDPAITSLAFVLTVALASLSWHCFEKPLIRLGHRLAY